MRLKDVEALRAEVNRLTLELFRLQQQYDEQTDCVIVHRGSELSCSDAMRAAYFDERRRAEQLAAMSEIASLEAAAKEAYDYTNMPMEVDPRDILELIAYIRALRTEVDELAKDAARYRWGINNARWIRSEQEAYVAIPVATDADLSCVAMRDAAIDAAMEGEK